MIFSCFPPVESFSIPAGPSKTAPKSGVIEATITLMNPSAAPTLDAPLTMSTREIAELTGKRHDNVMVDARNMLEQLGKAAPDFSGTALVPGPNNSTRSVPVFNLPKDLTLTLVAGYSVPLRHRIVTRLQELEARVAGPALPDLTDPAEAAMAWAQQYREKQALALQTQALALENQTAQGVNTLGSDRQG